LSGCGVSYKTRNKKEKQYLERHRSHFGSNKELLHKMPIYRATKNFITLQTLQHVIVAWKHFRNLEGIDPKGLKFSMFTFILSGRIPFK